MMTNRPKDKSAVSRVIDKNPDVNERLTKTRREEGDFKIVTNEKANRLVNGHSKGH